MTDMKCPFCQQELEKRHAATTDYNSQFITYYCGNPECESTTDLVGCKEFWDILGQLIRTRKALDVALDWLGQIATMEKCDDDLCREFTKRKLVEIKTALEQKDVK